MTTSNPSLCAGKEIAWLALTTRLWSMLLSSHTDSDHNAFSEQITFCKL